MGEEEERFGTALLVEGRFIQYIFGEDITHDKQKHKNFNSLEFPFQRNCNCNFVCFLQEKRSALTAISLVTT